MKVKIESLREIYAADLLLFIVTELDAKVKEKYREQKRCFYLCLQISWQMDWEKTEGNDILLPSKKAGKLAYVATESQ